MAKISLRVYNREIEGMIEGGQLDEAIAHCHHILRTFAMHIETYRLLGKAFLEGRRYADATDIFQRVLAAAPDDFVAHVGMSIIRDDESKLDEAIWHMERAFQVQPSNAAIQNELRRLYGRRDGLEPPKIRLSRDALANMYAQGDLFVQAIAEIRAILADDPNRPDLQVMLARAYLRAGQKVEAAEAAAQLLKKFPYCMDALRVLVEVLPGTARADNTQVYRQRLRLLDPYSAFVTGSVFNSDQVADAAVSLERLEYQPGKQAAPSQPTWAASLGVKLENERPPEAQPAWLADEVADSPAPGPEPGPASPGEPIPDFLRAAGWGDSEGNAEAAPADSGDQPPDETIAKGEMPDWLKSMAPPELSVQAEPEQEAAPVEGGDFPDWLTGLGAAAGAAALAGAAEEQPVETPQPAEPVQSEAQAETGAEEPLPDLEAALPGEQEPVPPAEEEPAARPVGIEDDTMAWLESLAAKQGAKPEELLTKPEARSEELPDWLKDVSQEQPPAPEPLVEAQAETQPPIQSEGEPVDTKPLEDTGRTLGAAAAVPHETGEAKPLGIEDDTMAWLESLAAKQGAKSEELLTKPEQRSGEMPGWLQETAGEAEPVPGLEPESAPEEQAAPLPEPAPETGLPALEAIEELAAPAEAGQPAAGEEDIADWLKDLEAEEKPSEIPVVPPLQEPPAVGAEELPDWLKDLEKQSAQPEEELGFAAPDLPEWLRQPAPSAPEAPLSQPTAEEPADSAWVSEEAASPAQPAATAPDEWIPEESPMPVPEQAAEPRPVEELAATISPSALPHLPKPTGALAPVPAQDKDALFLSGAQSALEASRLAEAMAEYAKLIKKNRLLDEVIHDLREALYRFPVDSIIWQTLGDAYMRAGRLQDALDAYTKAEELLR